MNMPLLFGSAAIYYWHLPLLIIVVSLVYSATRFEQWEMILREALRLIGLIDQAVTDTGSGDDVNSAVDLT